MYQSLKIFPQKYVNSCQSCLVNQLVTRKMAEPIQSNLSDRLGPPLLIPILTGFHIQPSFIIWQISFLKILSLLFFTFQNSGWKNYVIFAKFILVNLLVALQLLHKCFFVTLFSIRGIAKLSARLLRTNIHQYSSMALHKASHNLLAFTRFPQGLENNLTYAILYFPRNTFVSYWVFNAGMVHEKMSSSLLQRVMC